MLCLTNSEVSLLEWKRHFDVCLLSFCVLRENGVSWYMWRDCVNMLRKVWLGSECRLALTDGFRSLPTASLGIIQLRSQGGADGLKSVLFGELSATQRDIGASRFPSTVLFFGKESGLM